MRKSLIAGVFVVAVLSIAPFALSQIQNVKSTGGQLQGVVADGVASFKGIPFAAPPVGRSALEGSAACEGMDWRQKSGYVRSRLHAGSRNVQDDGILPECQ